MAEEPFVYAGKRYTPKPLHVSPCLFRGYTCPPGCGACCARFSLTYLPGEEQPGVGLKPFSVAFNMRKVLLLVDEQAQGGHHCRHVRKEDGRCGIHGKQPFSCDFEILRFKHHDDRAILGTFLYGRAWAMLRIVDEGRGAMCETTPFDDDVRADIARRLQRLGTWMEHFGLRTSRLARVLEHVRTGPHETALVL
jgi:hypothetical protein